MASTTWSMRLALLLCMALAVLGSLAADELTPLYERRGEVEQLELASHLARHARLPDLTDVAPGALRAGARPPLAAVLFAGALRAAGLREVRWLARRNPSIGERDRVVWLHGPDELAPRSAPLRRLRLVRGVGLAGALLAVLGAWLLARRLAPHSRAAPCAAAALLALDPALWSAAGAIGPTTWGAALMTLALAAWLGLDRTPGHAGAPRVVGSALLLGLAALTTPAAIGLLPVALVVLWRRRAREGGVRVGEFLIGLLLPLGPWLARNVALYGDALASDWLLPRGRVPPLSAAGFLERVALASVGESGHHAQLSGDVLDLWTLVAAGGAFGLLWQLLRTRQLDARACLLALGSLLVHALGLLLVAHDALPPHAGLGLLVAPTALALAAVGWRPWLGGRAGRVAAVLALTALAAAGILAQRELLLRTYWPPNRAHDGHLLAVDVLAGVPADARLPVLTFDDPPDGSIHTAPPLLRWTPARDPDARYTVHLSYAGLATSHRSWEDEASTAVDRLRVPEALWAGLPPGVPLLARLIRLPDPGRTAVTPLDELTVEVSPQRRLYRARPVDTAAGAAPTDEP